jgi:hypothetical protein
LIQKSDSRLKLKPLRETLIKKENGGERDDVSRGSNDSRKAFWYVRTADNYNYYDSAYKVIPSLNYPERRKRLN